MGMNVQDPKHESASYTKKAELYTVTQLSQYESYTCVGAIPHILNKIS